MYLKSPLGKEEEATARKKTRLGRKALGKEGSGEEKHGKISE